MNRRKKIVKKWGPSVELFYRTGLGGRQFSFSIFEWVNFPPLVWLQLPPNLLTGWGRQHSQMRGRGCSAEICKKEMREPRWLVPFYSLCHDISWLNTRQQNGIVMGKKSVLQKYLLLECLPVPSCWTFTKLLIVYAWMWNQKQKSVGNFKAVLIRKNSESGCKTLLNATFLSILWEPFSTTKTIEKLLKSCKG